MSKHKSRVFIASSHPLLYIHIQKQLPYIYAPVGSCTEGKINLTIFLDLNFFSQCRYLHCNENHVLMSKALEMLLSYFASSMNTYTHTHTCHTLLDVCLCKFPSSSTLTDYWKEDCSKKGVNGVNKRRKCCLSVLYLQSIYSHRPWHYYCWHKWKKWKEMVMVVVVCSVRDIFKDLSIDVITTLDLFLLIAIDYY